MVIWDDQWLYDDPNDFRCGWRMIIIVIKNDTSPGGLEVRTDLVNGDMDFAKQFVNRIIPEYKNRVIGWKITHVLPYSGHDISW